MTPPASGTAVAWWSGSGPRASRTRAWWASAPGLVALTVTVDMLESTGSDVYAHLSLNGHGRAGSDSGDEPLLRELAQATASEDPEVALAVGSELVARVGVSNSLTEGQEAQLWIDAGRIHLFDPASGRRLSG